MKKLREKTFEQNDLIYVLKKEQIFNLVSLIVVER